MSDECMAESACSGAPARASRQDCLALLETIIGHAPGGVRGTAVFLLDCDDAAVGGTRGGRPVLDEATAAEAARRIRAASPGWHWMLHGEQGEFIVIAQGLVDGGTVLGTAARLVHAFDEALQGAEPPVTAEVSVGIAFAPQHGMRAESLLAAAESGLREAIGAARRGQRRRVPRVPPSSS